MEYALLAFSWGMFYTFHSFLAASKLKRKLAKTLGSSFKWYRLFYSLFSIGFFCGIVYQCLFIPVRVLLTPEPILTYFGYSLATLGTIIALKASKQISLSSFLAIEPLTDSKPTLLVIEGWYARMRHPLYAGILLIFGGYFLISGSYSAIIHLGCLIFYLPFGIYFEEQNLVELFEDQYRVYRKKVPALFPLFWQSKKGA